MIRLGINIDHVATLRNARGEGHPNVVNAAKFVMKNGANLITVHLREDRRHIKDEDIKFLSKLKSIPINLEMAANFKMLKIALKYKPNYVCIVPEKRKEVTTEGGLDLRKNNRNILKIIKILNNNKIRTSLFINPKKNDIRLSKLLGVKCVELHTGGLSRKVKAKRNISKDLKNFITCSEYANTIGLEVHAGHGLDYETAIILSKVKNIKEFNIGHFIVGESIFFGISKVIKKFKKICR